MREPRTPISRSDLPSGYYKVLADPDAIDRWQKRVELRRQFEALKQKEGEIKRKPAAANDLKKNLESAYRSYRGQLVANAKRFLEKSKGSPDALKNLYKYSHLYHLESYIPLDVLLEAADLIADAPAENTISDAARKTALAKIEKEKTRIKTELAKASPAEDFGFDNGQAHSDLIDEFVKHWQGIQGSTRGECDCRGISLKFAAEIDQKLYYRLKIDQIVTSRSDKWLPYSPNSPE